MKRALVVFSMLAVMTAALPASAADYPEKPVTMICGFPAGGGLDVTARAIVEAVKPFFPKPIAVVNRPGAAGTIGVSEVAAAKPDGYTIGIGAVASFVVAPHRTKLAYGPPDDYRPIANLVDIPLCLSVRADAPWKTLEEFLAYAKSNPGRVRVGLAGGLGTLFHLNVEQLKAKAKVDLTAVPFAGAAESVPALLGGHVDADCHTIAEVIPHVKAGKARVLGVFENNQNPLLVGVPTFKSKGLDITQGAYYLIFGPKDLSAAIVSTLEQTFKKGVAQPTFIKAVSEQGYVVHFQPPDEIKDRLARDYKELGQVVKALGLDQPKQ